MTNTKTPYQASHPRSSSPAISDIEQAPSLAGANQSETPKDYKSLFDARAAHTKFVDPCEDARKESMRCLDKNNYNRDACTEFFKSYRECKKKWLNQRRDDRRAGMDV